MLVRIGCEGIHIIGAPANPYAGAFEIDCARKRAR
jgi:hypothetical protein